MGGIGKAISKLFGGGQSAPAPVTIQSPAPATQAPEADIAQKASEGDLAENRKKRRGKASLTIDKTNSTNTGTSGSGLNI